MMDRRTYRQAKWSEPLIFELSEEGRVGYRLPELDETVEREVGDYKKLIPTNMIRSKPPRLPEVSEVNVTRHYTRLSQMNWGVDSGIYPLGSCTMKYNPRINEAITGLMELTNIHPYQSSETMQGLLEILYTLQKWLAEITGAAAVSLQPAAGAHGELLGALLIRAYHKYNGELDKRSEMLIPDSAHGTNPASARMGGFEVVVLPSDENGLIDMEALKSSVSDKTAGLMLTNPNTLGLFEKNIVEVAKIVHDAGALLYYDGANLNPILGKVRPGDMGFDIIHINTHKTFSTPHGGGGPGAGPVAVCERLTKFLPVPVVEYDGSKYYLNYDLPYSIGKIKGFYGNISVLVRAYCYILSMGFDGLKEAAEASVLNANYIKAKLEKTRGLSLKYSPQTPRKHEVVFSASPLLKETGVSALDIAKNLLDLGVHAPTNYFPLILSEALMIEPTETESKEELDKFINS
ncbi:MAG: aminomethyl-transferring glycine dehydrogenase subunit GcvPB, partial [Candidatus Odinarchaeota archaeon]